MRRGEVNADWWWVGRWGWRALRNGSLFGVVAMTNGASTGGGDGKREEGEGGGTAEKWIKLELRQSKRVRLRREDGDATREWDS